MPTTAQAHAALAHPLRSRILTELRQGGPATATRLAAALGTNSGATSYHVRRLAEVGLVEDAPDGHGRERLWRSVEAVADGAAEPTSGVVDEADDAEALRWLERDYVRHNAEQSDRWLDAEPGWPAAWRRAAGTRDAVVLVTADQLATLRAELAEVLQRHRRVGQGNPDAKRVVVYTTAFPLDVDRPPRPPR